MLSGDRRRLLETFRYVHAARKVPGVGSAETRAIVLILGGEDPLSKLAGWPEGGLTRSRPVAWSLLIRQSTQWVLRLPGNRLVNQNEITARNATASIDVFNASSWALL